MKQLQQIPMLLLFLGVFLLGSSTANGQKIYRLNESFNTTKNPSDVWHYGYGTIGGDFTPCPKFSKRGTATVWETNEAWKGIYYNPQNGQSVAILKGLALKPNMVVLHPGNNSDHLIKVRFVCPADGDYSVNVTWKNIDEKATKTWNWVFTNATSLTGKPAEDKPAAFKELFTKGLDGYNKSHNFEKVISMKKGEVISFETGNGANGNADDAQSINLSIRNIPGTGAVVTSSTVYKVGDDHPCGGIVFNVDASGTKGFVVAYDDIGKFSIPEANSAMKVQLGDGWALPNEAQLRQIYNNLHKKGIGNFKPAFYRTGQMASAAYAWMINFENGRKDGGGHINNKVLCRPIKAFPCTNSSVAAPTNSPNNAIFGIRKVECYAVNAARDVKERFYIGVKAEKGVIVTPNPDGRYKNQNGTPQVMEVQYMTDNGKEAVVFRMKGTDKYFAIQGSDVVLRKGMANAAIFYVKPNLAGATEEGWASFESKANPNHYLRHQNFVLRVNPMQNAVLYKQDASFKFVAE